MALAASGFAVGLLWTGCYSLLFRAPAHALISQESGVYTLTVTDFPFETSRGAAFPAKLSREGGLDPKIVVYAEAVAMDLRPGDVIQLTLSLARSDISRGASYDYYESMDIYLLGYARGEPVLLERPAVPPVTTWPQYSVRALKGALLRDLPEDISGVVIAIATGDKSFLPTGIYAAFRRAGLAHIVAVSGLHISFLVGLMAFILGRRNRMGLVVTIIVIFFFAAMAGNSPSSLRATLTLMLANIALQVNREEDTPTILSAALVLLLLMCPYSCTSIGLQLSFAAVAGIYLITGPLIDWWRERIPKWDKPLGKLLRRFLLACTNILSVTLGALVFTTPLGAIHFRSISLAGPIANLLTLWTASLTFLGGLITALVGLLFPGLAQLLGWCVSWPARWVVLVARLISKLPFAALSLRSGYMLLWFVVAYTIVLIWVFTPRVRPSIPLAALVLCLCPALLANAWPTLTGELTLAALDVGQGASTLIWSKGHAVLVDCGGNSLDDPGDIAADYLQSLGTSKLDALILTHFHADHANGVPELLERLDVSLLIAPELLEDDPYRDELLALAEGHGCEVKLLSENTTVSFGGADLTLYAPLGSGGENEEGLSVLCTAGDFDALITGDMNDVVESRLVKYNSLPDIELLMVGHHGSKTSTSEALLLSTTPVRAVISCGYNNYGHPAEETLERLGAAGCDIYRTDLMGTVTFTVKGESK